MIELTAAKLKDNKNQLKIKLYSKNKIKRYLYTIKSTSYEENLCSFEMKCLFNKIPKRKHFFSYHYINPHRSPFIKQCVSIVYIGNTIESIVNQIINDNLSYEKFKVYCFNIEKENISFDDRRKIESIIGFNINGNADVHNPEVLLGITRVGENWVFGELDENKSSWKSHNKKPYYYSNALSVNVARAVVNIAVGNNLNYKVVDPCCGIGTVVIEGLSLGLDIEGYEINPYIAENANKNLDFFGFKYTIVNGDMHKIKGKFDVAIVDLPYGLFSLTTFKEQIDIIKTARRISNKLVLITLEEMDKHLNKCGFNIVDRCHVSKGKFKRYITVCV